MIYEHPLCLDQELSGIRGLQRQMQCYLAVMHALRLAKSEYDSSSRHYLGGEEKLHSIVSKCSLDIVELPDHENEYLLVDACLFLSRKILSFSYLQVMSCGQI